MRAQLRDHSDIVGSLVMAPPVEKLLRSKEDSNPEKLFSAPIGRIHVGLHVSSHHIYTHYSKGLYLANLLHCQLQNGFTRMRYVTARRGKCRIVYRGR